MFYCQNTFSLHRGQFPLFSSHCQIQLKWQKCLHGLINPMKISETSPATCTSSSSSIRSGPIQIIENAFWRCLSLFSIKDFIFKRSFSFQSSIGLTWLFQWEHGNQNFRSKLYSIMENNSKPTLDNVNISYYITCISKALPLKTWCRNLSKVTAYMLYT